MKEEKNEEDGAHETAKEEEEEDGGREEREGGGGGGGGGSFGGSLSKSTHAGHHGNEIGFFFRSFFGPSRRRPFPREGRLDGGDGGGGSSSGGGAGKAGVREGGTDGVRKRKGAKKRNGERWNESIEKVGETLTNGDRGSQ